MHYTTLVCSASIPLHKNIILYHDIHESGQDTSETAVDSSPIPFFRNTLPVSDCKAVGNALKKPLAESELSKVLARLDGLKTTDFAGVDRGLDVGQSVLFMKFYLINGY